MGLYTHGLNILQHLGLAIAHVLPWYGAQNIGEKPYAPGFLG